MQAGEEDDSVRRAPNEDEALLAAKRMHKR